MQRWGWVEHEKAHSRRVNSQTVESSQSLGAFSSPPLCKHCPVTCHPAQRLQTQAWTSVLLCDIGLGRHRTSACGSGSHAPRQLLEFSHVKQETFPPQRWWEGELHKVTLQSPAPASQQACRERTWWNYTWSLSAVFSRTHHQHLRHSVSRMP